MWRESGFDPTISQIGGGPGRGLCQWTVSDRWQTLIQWASSQGMDHMTIEAQCGFVDHELSGGGLGPWMAKYGSLESFKATDDPAWAVAWFYDVFERGANRGGDIAKSTPVAQKYYNMWHNYDQVGGGTGQFIDPTQGVGPVSQRAHWHGNAIDIACPSGTPLVASDGGTVSAAGGVDGYGIAVFIEHGPGTQTRYAHMSQVVVSSGEAVTQGQLIGYSGNTGPSSGPHLHFEICLNGAWTYPGPLIGR